MIYIKDTLDFSIESPTAVTLGKFDGLHRGHDLLMQNLQQIRNNYGCSTVAFTFDIPPKSKLGEDKYQILTTNIEKEYIFEKRGIDYLIECPFTPEIMHMDPEDFISWIAKSLNMKYVVVGDDFCFGYNRQGNYKTLIQCQEKYGYTAVVVPKMQDEGRDISSTYIREEIKNGRISKANELLGYPYLVKSQVIHGKKLGRTIGIPTINMAFPEEKLLPANGVYVTSVEVNGKIYGGVTNVGKKPTVSKEDVIGVETFILDFSGDVYGEEVVVSFLDFIRGEQKFASLDELQTQMQKDISYARKCYENVTNMLTL